MKMRIHGDYHLGQVLFTGQGFRHHRLRGRTGAFAGRAQAQAFAAGRRGGDAALLPLRDFERAAQEGGGAARRRGAARSRGRNSGTRTWRAVSCARTARPSPGAKFVPKDPAAFEKLLQAFLLEKAVYEVGYELNNRPDWMAIPDPRDFPGDRRRAAAAISHRRVGAGLAGRHLDCKVLIRAAIRGRFRSELYAVWLGDRPIDRLQAVGQAICQRHAVCWRRAFAPMLRDLPRTARPLLNSWPRASPRPCRRLPLLHPAVMKTTPLFVETLESRVAPAILVNGGNLLGGNGNPTTGETSSGGNTVTSSRCCPVRRSCSIDAGAADHRHLGRQKHPARHHRQHRRRHRHQPRCPTAASPIPTATPPTARTAASCCPTRSRGSPPIPSDRKTATSAGSSRAARSTTSTSAAASAASTRATASSATAPPPWSTLGTVDYNTIQPGLQNTFVLTQANASRVQRPTSATSSSTPPNQLEIFAGSGCNNAGARAAIGGTITNVTITETLTGQGSKPALFLHAGDGGAGTYGGAGRRDHQFRRHGSIAYVKVQTGDGGTVPRRRRRGRIARKPRPS